MVNVKLQLLNRGWIVPGQTLRTVVTLVGVLVFILTNSNAGALIRDVVLQSGTHILAYIAKGVVVFRN